MDATVCTIVTQNVLEPVSPDDTSNPSLLPFVLLFRSVYLSNQQNASS